MSETIVATPRPWRMAEPTAEQLAEFWKVCTDAERLAYAKQAMRLNEAAMRCTGADHVGAIEYWRAAFHAVDPETRRAAEQNALMGARSRTADTLAGFSNDTLLSELRRRLAA